MKPRGAVPAKSLQTDFFGFAAMNFSPRKRPYRRRARALAGVLAAIAVAISGPASMPVAAQTAEKQEIVSQEKPATFKLHVQRNLVLVRVVVRDGKGRAQGGLRKEDFKLFDNRKPQVISQFSVETPAAHPPAEAKPAAPENPPEAGEAPRAPAGATPQRFLALYFDDLNLAFEDLARGREAAARFLAAMQPTERAGIFTSSAQNTLDFTGDRAKLQEALSKLRINPRTSPGNDCPEISDYQAQQIVDYQDPQAIAVAVDEDVYRCHDDPRMAQQAILLYARRAFGQYEYQSHLALQTIEQLVRRMGTLPGQRNVIVVSGGFLPLGLRVMLGDIADRALRTNVVISSLDPRGLPVLLPEADASRQYLPMDGILIGMIHSLNATREMAAGEVMAQLAADTGGEFFHNNNDLDAGFAKVAATPETYYVLAFSPQNLKYDGSFHSLKVTLVDSHGYALRARRGYFAPRKLLDAGAQAKEEVETATFSQDEMKELPVDVHTQFFKSGNGDAQLSVVVHLDIHSLRFRKEQDRNASELTFVTVLFDRDGKYTDGKEKQVNLRLRDSTLNKLLGTGISLKTSFAVKPGAYVVRQVVRDSEDGHVAALNSSVEIPY